jgi:hypothetical protein
MIKGDVFNFRRYLHSHIKRLIVNHLQIQQPHTEALEGDGNHLQRFYALESVRPSPYDQ